MQNHDDDEGEEEEEDTTRLKIGKEFYDGNEVRMLLVSEVAEILRDNYGKKLNESTTIPERFMKSLSYSERFHRFKDANATEQAAALLADCSPKLHQFEVAALGNLLPETAEEARALIPSLSGEVPAVRGEGFTDDQLEEICEQLNAHRKLE